MGFDLNAGEFNNNGTGTIFNNGVAGKVDNVLIDVQKRQADEPDNSPDYKVFFTDDNGSQINMGLYYFSRNEGFDDARNASLEKLSISRAVSIAKSVVPAEFEFPKVDNSKEAIDVLMKITKEHSAGKRVNVFATYGTVKAPKKYLGVYKNFDFIEAAGTNPSRLRATVNPNKPEYNDVLENIVADVPSTDSGTPAPKPVFGGWPGN